MLHGISGATAMWAFEKGTTLRTLYQSSDPNEEFKGLRWMATRMTPPPPIPKCGFDGKLCKTDNAMMIAIISIGVLAVVGIAVGLSAMYVVRKMNYETSLKQVSSSTVKWANVDLKNVGKGIMSQMSVGTTGSNMDNRQVFADIGKYKGDKITFKRLGNINIDMKNRDTLVELLDMSTCKDGNINHFVGVCIDAPDCAILMAYNPKGSVQDVLADDTVTLTWDFKISMVNDIANGMRYLHSTNISSHGRLSSSKCVVDGRWTCKISGHGLLGMRSIAIDDRELSEYALSQKKYWVAPEFLRMASPPIQGSKAADVYSYGIITSEIVIRDIPYSENQPELDANETADQVLSGTNPPYRPSIPSSKCPQNWRDMMQACWEEDPEARPTFHRILNMIKEINGGKLPNLIDSMINRLEAHTRTLEDRVAERSKELHAEKSKVEVLLNELLPRSVAEALKAGKNVKPEAFENMTLFFSDIVGFTNISARGTPMQVVVMLNNMYTAFDEVASHFDVYKVATIGDAYMVSSGVPIRNGDQHAHEIVAMSIGLLEASAAFPIPHMPGEHLRMRVGIHTGPVVAGVAGLKMPRYLLFGDTVDIASKMESGGEAMRIHISDTTEDLIRKDGAFEIILRGEMEVKGKGLINTYWVNGFKK